MGQNLDTDYERIMELRNAPPNSEDRRPLDEVKPSGFDQNGMIIAVTCGDGDRIGDILDHKWRTHGCKLHLIAMNGGAMLLSQHCPANRTLAWHDFMSQGITAATELKQTNLVALGAHYPCGLAKLLGLSAEDVIRLTVDGRRELKRAKPDLEVYCFLHVAHPDGRPRTYTIDHKYPSFSQGGILEPARVAGSGGGW